MRESDKCCWNCGNGKNVQKGTQVSFLKALRDGAVCWVNAKDGEIVEDGLIGDPHVPGDICDSWVLDERFLDDFEDERW